MTLKTYLVTGGSSGIGLATARKLAAQGARLVLAGRDPDRLARVAGELGGSVLTTVAADLGSLDGVKTLATAARGVSDRLDGLVLNAGTAPFTSVEGTDQAVFDATFDLNVKGRFFLVQALLPALADGASIVMTASGISDRPLPESSLFAASMEACRALARALSVDLRERRIRVNTVSPGPIDTPIYGSYGMPDDAVAALKADLGEKTLAGRMGRAEEVATAIVFLLGDGLVTGVDLLVDGGYRLS